MGTAQCSHWQQPGLTKAVVAAQHIRQLFQRDLTDCKSWLSSLAGAQRERREAQEKWSLLSLFTITQKMRD